MVINHLDKLFVTNDAATILRELEVRNLIPVLYKVFVFGKLYRIIGHYYFFLEKYEFHVSSEM